MKKESIEKGVRELLAFAESRRTEQGVLVYKSVLRMLQDATSESEIADIRSKLNHALIGIEAHGHFTDEEFLLVRMLRGEGER